MKYLKRFNQHSDYNTYITGQDKILPNISYCENEDELHFTPIEKRVVVKFNVTSTGNATSIMYSSATSNFTEIEIDGVVQPSVVSSYTFDTTGEHTIKYTLADPTTIGNFAFQNCTTLTNITIPNSVTIIGQNAFSGCSGLTSVTIPDSVTTIRSDSFQACYALTSVTIPNSVTTIGSNTFSFCTSLTSVIIGNSVTTIGDYAFQYCDGLTSVTIQATTPPTLDDNAFDSTSDCPIYVPSASVDTYKAATNWSNYASRIQAIP